MKVCRINDDGYMDRFDQSALGASRTLMGRN